MVKFKEFSRLLSVFQVLLKANLVFNYFSRQSCIFKYFSSLCNPAFCNTLRPPNKCAKLKIIFLISQPKHNYIVGTKTDRLKRDISFEHPKHMFKSMDTKYLQFHAQKVSKSGCMRLDGRVHSSRKGYRPSDLWWAWVIVP